MGSGASSTRAPFNPLEGVQEVADVCTCHGCRNRRRCSSSGCRKKLPLLPTDEAFMLSTALRVIERSHARIHAPPPPLLAAAQLCTCTLGGLPAGSAGGATPIATATPQRPPGTTTASSQLDAIATPAATPATNTSASATSPVFESPALTPRQVAKGAAVPHQMPHKDTATAVGVELAAMEAFSQATVQAHIVISQQTPVGGHDGGLTC
jgi:hypothetical protein